MSAIGAIFSVNNRPLDPATLLSLWDGLALRGPDGGDFVIRDSIGMCYRAFHTNRESRLEKQPLVAPDGRILIADLRIDNREDLVKELADFLHGHTTTITDIQIAMAAHERWGDMFPARLIGEYALILWNPADRTVLMARDHIGARTLYYLQTKETLVCSSELLPLLDMGGISLEIDDEYVAGYLAQNPEPSLTPYKKIHTLQPGCLGKVIHGKLREQRYWSLNSSIQIRYKTDREYEEHFLYLLQEAVRAPLRADGPVFADLSGGLDSSSIVCVADQIITNGEVQCPHLETVSQVFDESPTSDERKFIRCVEDQRGRSGHHLAEEQYRLLSPTIKTVSMGTINLCLISFEYHRALCAAMRRSGARVLLSGQGGDEMLNCGTNPASELADLLFEFHPLQLHRSLKVWSESLNKPYPQLLWKYSILPCLSEKTQFKLNNNPVLKKSRWFNSDFAKRMNLYDRMAGASDIFDCRLPSARMQARGFVSAVQSIAAGYRREIADIEVSYPFLHRPLVEFLQAIPFEQRVRPGETRSLMRRSLRNLLPDKTLRRQSKGNPTEAFLRAVIREYSWLSEMFEEPRVCSYGYVDGAKFKAELNKARMGCEVNATLFLKIIPLELWLRAIENKQGFKKSTSSKAWAPVRPAVFSRRLYSGS